MPLCDSCLFFRLKEWYASDDERIQDFYCIQQHKRLRRIKRHLEHTEPEGFYHWIVKYRYDNTVTACRHYHKRTVTLHDVLTSFYVPL